MPMLSTSRRNSPASGSAVSRPMIFRQSCTGRPDLMPRTMMSMASEKVAVNLLVRRLARKPRTHCGRPSAQTPPRPSAIIQFTRISSRKANTQKPNTALPIQNCSTVKVRPACSSRLRRLIRIFFCLRS